MEIGSKIKQLRSQAGITQEQLANKLGISAQAVSKWETAITMPDISLLPALAGELGVSIDELFDLTKEQKLHRIERRMDMEEEFTQQTFAEYEIFLKTQLEDDPNNAYLLSLLANLYHHRMDSDSRKVSKYARQAILQAPEKKDCQWLLTKAEGATVWDWNMGNHTGIIDFYKKVIAEDAVTPKTPLPYYYLMDNLIADHRTKEAKAYLEIIKTLPAHRPFLIPVYEAYIALAEYNAEKADAIMTDAEITFGNDEGFLFEKAQYHAMKCEYEDAIRYYELSWEMNKQKARFTDPLHAISIIHVILGNKEGAVEAYDRMLRCLKEEWGYSDDDAAVIEVQRERNQLLNKA